MTHVSADLTHVVLDAGAVVPDVPDCHAAVRVATHEDAVGGVRGEGQHCLVRLVRQVTVT